MWRSPYPLVISAVCLLIALSASAADMRLMERPERGDTATEWKRSRPDIVVYLPKGEQFHDTDNEHFLVFEAPKSDELLATWTQSSCEGRGDNHLVIARSADAGETWSGPQFIAGTRPGTEDPQASWGFPIVSEQGRIYLFYTKETEGSKRNPQGSGPMGCCYSDDNGQTWTQGADIAVPRNRFDDPDPAIEKNWIVWQLPIRDSKGRWLAGYTQVSSTRAVKPPSGWWTWDSRCAFMRFENIDDNPAPADIAITWLPKGIEGLEVPNRLYPHISMCQEPGLVLLPDGRLFTVMRTMTGWMWYSVSDDDGETWREPEPLRYKDGGVPVPHPLSPGPVYALEDGRYVLLHHNNEGRVGAFSQFKSKWETNQLNYIRNPMYVSVGTYQPDAHQPIWFDWPVKLLDTDDVPVGPKGTAEIGTYTSLTEYQGKRILWYPDRKYYLLGLYLTDEVLENGRE